jgi:hypothetical protein
MSPGLQCGSGYHNIGWNKPRPCTLHMSREPKTQTSEPKTQTTHTSSTHTCKRRFESRKRLGYVNHLTLSITSQEYHPHSYRKKVTRKSTLKYKLDYDENLTRASRSNTGMTPLQILETNKQMLLLKALVSNGANDRPTTESWDSTCRYVCHQIQRGKGVSTCRDRIMSNKLLPRSSERDHLWVLMQEDLSDTKLEKSPCPVASPKNALLSQSSRDSLHRFSMRVAHRRCYFCRTFLCWSLRVFFLYCNTLELYRYRNGRRVRRGEHRASDQGKTHTWKTQQCRKRDRELL